MEPAPALTLFWALSFRSLWTETVVRTGSVLNVRQIRLHRTHVRLDRTNIGLHRINIVQKHQQVDDCGDIKENTASFAPTRTPFLCDHCFSLKSEGRPLTPGRSGSLGRPFPIRDDAR